MRMKQFKLSYIYLLAVLLVAGSCKKQEEEIPRGEFATGVFVVNEGNFGDADGTISFFDPTVKTSTQDIYAKANGSSISGTFQSVYFYGTNAFIIDQAGHKIEVVEAETFKHIATIDQGLNVPRYMTVANGKGYVSNWGPYDANWNTPNSFIAVIDLTNFSVIKTINTENGVEGMATVNETVYAAASGSTIVHIIDSQLDEITGVIQTPSAPRLLAEDATGKLWVLCNDYVTSNLARLDLINETMETSFTIEGGAKSLAINGTGDKVYYLCTPWGALASVNVVDITAAIAPSTPLVSGDSFYGLGVDPSDETIYIGKSNGADNGTIIRFNSSGAELDNFPSGRFPNGFEFRK